MAVAEIFISETCLEKSNLSYPSILRCGFEFTRQKEAEPRIRRRGYLVTKFLGFVIIGACPVVFILRTVRTAAEDRRDINRIYQFLHRNVEDGQYRFRSSEAISTATNLPVSRIADLCTKHPRIDQKAHERHTWRVVNTAETDEPADHFRQS